MNKIIKRILLSSLLLLLFIPGTQTLAASKKTKALKAYSKFLAKHESKFLSTIPQYGYYSQTNSEKAQSAAYFLLVDLDKNGIPELVTRHIVGYKFSILYVYTYKNGKVKRVKNAAIFVDKTAPYVIQATTYTSAASGSGLTVFKCKKKHLHIGMMSGAGRDEYVCYMKNGKLKLYAHAQDHYYTDGNLYRYKGKIVSYAKYNSITKGCTNTLKDWMTNNNRAERKKKLK